MATQSLNLPFDIPWKRLAVSADMIDTSFGDALFPPKWRSSIAVFFYEPDELPPEYCDRAITYLKITYTITGYQLDQKEIEFEFAPEGEPLVSVPVVVRARGTLADGAWPRMQLRVNGTVVGEWDVATPDGGFASFTAAANIPRGGQDNFVEVAFLNDYDGEKGDRNLFVDSVSVGSKVLAPNGPRTSYVVQSPNGPYTIEPGQRELWSQGALVLEFDYDPKDWMAQLVEEYENLGAYLPCYGAILHAAVFPSATTKARVETRCSGFDTIAPSDDHRNPLVLGDVELTADGVRNTEVVEGTAQVPRALKLVRQTTARLPATSRCEARVYHAANSPVTVVALRGDDVVKVSPVPPQPDTVHTLTFEGEGIDRLVFELKNGEGFLAEICYDVVVEEPLGPEDFPYVAAFEPEKREMYETVTDSGEVLSRSLSGINVRKGFTTTESEEVFDIDSGLSLASSSSAGGVAASNSFAWQGQRGTRNVNQSQRENVRTADSSREKRETSSHSTTLSQMYHLFNGYHLGTNRALFFMLPRPHVVEPLENGHPLRTFANGPRQLEGVQEVFLVVSRPKDVPGLCVEALLETAHLDWKVTQEITQQPTERPVPIATLTRWLMNHFHGTSYSYTNTNNNTTYEHHITEVFWSPTGQYFFSRGYRDNDRSFTHIGQPSEADWGLGSRDDRWSYEDALEEYFKENPPETAPPTTRTETTMLLTARSVTGCLTKLGVGACDEHAADPVSDGSEWVSHETSIPVPPNATRADGGNRLVGTIGREMRASFGSGKRYPKGSVDFLHTRYAVNRLKRWFAAMPSDAAENTPLDKIGGIDGDVRKRIAKAFPKARTRKEVLSIHVDDLRKELRLSALEARDLQLRLAGVARGAKAGAGEGSAAEPSPKQDTRS